MKDERELAKKSVELSFEFTRYLLAHPELEGKIPEEALIAFEVAEDPELTRYQRELAARTKAPTQPLIVVHIKRLAPTRLVEPEVTFAT